MLAINTGAHSQLHLHPTDSLPTGKICMLFCHRLIFFKINFFLKNSFKNTLRVSNGLDPDQDRHFVGPDLDLNVLQKLSADGTRRYRVNLPTAAVHKILLINKIKSVTLSRTTTL